MVRKPYKGRSVALALHSGKVLLVRSKRTPEAWVPPGGTIEPGETASQAACRETYEETGTRVVAGRLVGYGELWADDHDAIELYFAAQPLDRVQPPPEGEFVIGEEQRTACWFEVSALTGVRHFPQALAELCYVSQSPDAAPLYLGAREMGDEPA